MQSVRVRTYDGPFFLRLLQDFTTVLYRTLTVEVKYCAIVLYPSAAGKEIQRAIIEPKYPAVFISPSPATSLRLEAFFARWTTKKEGLNKIQVLFGITRREGHLSCTSVEKECVKCK